MLHARASPGNPAAALGLKPEVPDEQLSAMSCLQLTKLLGKQFPPIPPGLYWVC